jgi:hypothetical protein
LRDLYSEFRNTLLAKQNHRDFRKTLIASFYGAQCKKGGTLCASKTAHTGDIESLVGTINPQGTDADGVRHIPQMDDTVFTTADERSAIGTDLE